MRNRGIRAGGLVAGLLSLTCASCAPEENATRQTSQEVVYGTDDRFDVYAHPDQTLRVLASQSVVAMMSSSDLSFRDPENLQVLGSTLGVSKNLCATERFRNDPTAASCSGTLIDDDLVLTAGHCVTSQTSCSRALFVFNYYRDSATSLHRITQSDVFRCASIVTRYEGTDAQGRQLDYAVLRLDRPATPRFQPATVRTTATAVTGSVAIIGFGSGIPAKIDSGGSVRDPRSSLLDYFLATTDSFGGNSGSGVFDPTTRDVVGILVRGDTDYVPMGGCSVVNRCSETGCSGESVTYAFRAIEALCRTGTSARLCGSPASCGNSICEPGEDITSCARDCSPPSCGDGRCNGAETSVDCPADCGPMIPTSWTCRSAWYNAGDTCDCNCGAPDPDCANASLRVTNCPTGSSCSARGTCIIPPVQDAGTARDAGASDAQTRDVVGDGSVGAEGMDLARGCGCRVVSRGESAPLKRGWLLALVGAVAIMRRRLSSRRS